MEASFKPTIITTKNAMFSYKINILARSKNFRFVDCQNFRLWRIIFMVRPRTILKSVSGSVSTQMSKQANSRLSGPWLITGQLYSHSRCKVHVYTQLGAQHSQKLSREIGMSVDTVGGSYANFDTSKYTKEVI